jgi:hypothetical protein
MFENKSCNSIILKSLLQKLLQHPLDPITTNNIDLDKKKWNQHASLRCLRLGELLWRQGRNKVAIQDIEKKSVEMVLFILHLFYTTVLNVVNNANGIMASWEYHLHYLDNI